MVIHINALRELESYKALAVLEVHSRRPLSSDNKIHKINYNSDFAKSARYGCSKASLADILFLGSISKRF